jgi:hypothetical protein
MRVARFLELSVVALFAGAAGAIAGGILQYGWVGIDEVHTNNIAAQAGAIIGAWIGVVYYAKDK